MIGSFFHNIIAIKSNQIKIEKNWKIIPTKTQPKINKLKDNFKV
jgi:hypothetical protein